MNLTQTQLASLASIDRSLVSLVEKGSRNLPPSLAKVLLSSLPWHFLEDLPDQDLAHMVLQASKAVNCDIPILYGAEILGHRALREGRTKDAMQWGRWLLKKGIELKSNRLFASGGNIQCIAMRNAHPTDSLNHVNKTYEIITKLETLKPVNWVQSAIHTSYRELIAIVTSSVDFSSRPHPISTSYKNIILFAKEKLITMEDALTDESMVSIHYEMLARSESCLGSLDVGEHYLDSSQIDGADKILMFPRRITQLRLLRSVGMHQEYVDACLEIESDAQSFGAKHYADYVRRLRFVWSSDRS